MTLSEGSAGSGVGGDLGSAGGFSTAGEGDGRGGDVLRFQEPESDRMSCGGGCCCGGMRGGPLIKGGGPCGSRWW